MPQLLSNLAHIAVVAPFERTVGDEVQGVPKDAAATYEVIRQAARLGSWHIGIGVGEGNIGDDGGSRSGAGPAFIAAREAVEASKTTRLSFALRSALSQTGENGKTDESTKIHDDKHRDTDTKHREKREAYLSYDERNTRYNEVNLGHDELNPGQHEVYTRYKSNHAEQDTAYTSLPPERIVEDTQAAIGLWLSLILRRSQAQWQAIDLLESGKNGKEAARILGITEQAFSQRRIASEYEEERAARPLILSLLSCVHDLASPVRGLT